MNEAKLILENHTESIFYSPSSIVSIFNAATVTKEEKKIINVRGIFQKTGTANYGGSYYNTLKDEAGEYSVTLIVSELIHHQLEHNKTIELSGYITRRPDKSGRIVIYINLVELLDQRVNKFSEEEVKKIELINKKVEKGFKDLDALIKRNLFNNRRTVIKVIIGKSAIIDADIKTALGTAVAFYDIEYHRVSLSAPAEIAEKILSFDSPSVDLVCVARGGGENLEIFDKVDLCANVIDCETIIASALGHATNVPLFEKLSDKKFTTPTNFGNYLKEVYNSTIEDLEKSKAKIAEDLKRQYDTNYGKQIQNLTEQLKATKELHEKTLTDTTLMLTNKLQTFEEIKTKQESSLKNQIDLLASQNIQKDAMLQQANTLATNYQHQLAEAKSKSGPNIFTIILAVIIGIIIGMAIFSLK